MFVSSVSSVQAWIAKCLYLLILMVHNAGINDSRLGSPGARPVLCGQ